MNVLFVNPVPPRCGVHQYGLRFFSLLADSQVLKCELTSTSDTAGRSPDVVIYNWHPIIDPPCEVLQRSEFRASLKVVIYHDGAVPMLYDALLFSNPDAENHNPKAHMIGRPLPRWEENGARPANPDVLTIGIAGFCGGWAADAVSHCVRNSDHCHFRLHLPPSDWCDPEAVTAKNMVAQCQSLLRPGDELEVNHDFLSEHEMLLWLSRNHVNCYIRNSTPSIGISSATDNALAVRRPLAINRSPMFRHMFNSKPSICVEDTPLREILTNGVAPLIPHYIRNHRITVRGEIEQILLSL